MKMNRKIYFLEQTRYYYVRTIATLYNRNDYTMNRMCGQTIHFFQKTEEVSESLGERYRAGYFH